MARRKKVYNRPETRDPRYDSAVVGKLISKVMRDGKRSLSERIVYAAIDKANDGTDTVDPLEVVTRALENAKPLRVPGHALAGKLCAFQERHTHACGTRQRNQGCCQQSGQRRS